MPGEDLPAWAYVCKLLSVGAHAVACCHVAVLALHVRNLGSPDLLLCEVATLTSWLSVHGAPHTWSASTLAVPCAILSEAACVPGA